MTLKLWLYAIAGGVVLALLASVLFTVKGWKDEAARVPQLEQEIRNHEATIAEIHRQVQAADAASAGYQEELARLRTTADAAPIPVVRVCKSAPAKAPVRVPAAEPGPDAGSPAGGVLPETPGPDIGPALYGDANTCDALSAQIRGLQAYIEEITNAGESRTETESGSQEEGSHR